MQILKHHVLGGTKQDLQGERLTKQFLEEFTQRYIGRKMVIYPHHNVAERPVGFIENIQVVPYEDDSEEWKIIGDVHLEDGYSEADFGGFSVSGPEMIRAPDNPDLILYLPFAGYRDEALIQELLGDKHLSLGKWIKKGDVVSCALFSTVLVLVLTPVWDDIYKREVAPKIRRFMHEVWPRLKAKEISLEHIQQIEYEANTIQLRFSGVRGHEELCFNDESLYQGHSVAITVIREESREIRQVSLVFDLADKEYFIHWIELMDGEYIHFA